jgi:hypothetical protein
MVEYSVNLIQSGGRFFSSLDNALERAGWLVTRFASDDGDNRADMALLVEANGENRSPPDGAGTPLLALVSDQPEAGFRADLVISPTMSVEAMTALFRAWLPPDTAALDRMVGMLGREGLAPVVAGLRDELAQAIDCIRNGEEAPAHRLAGLAGTLGFAALSAAWRAIDAGGGDMRDARRESRITLLALDRWLAR